MRITTIYVLSRNIKKILDILCENFQFLEVKFSIYLNRRVFVMTIFTLSIQADTPEQTVQTQNTHTILHVA